MSTYVRGRNRSPRSRQIEWRTGTQRMEMFVHVGVHKRSTGEIDDVQTKGTRCLEIPRANTVHGTSRAHVETGPCNVFKLTPFRKPVNRFKFMPDAGEICTFRSRFAIFTFHWPTRIAGNF
ncbi:uncharacterized protein LOC143148033 [Ptiloglossa arizonensis]|uniref:uncharacterized protein LOC143148033 n=1 Tax=Ptiloglossa arizonensis TaxID=3350558 RepID=UPI003F9FF601